MRGLRRAPGVRYPVLVPNARGLERAQAAGATEIAVFTAASESFTQANIGMSIDRSLRGLRDGCRGCAGGRDVGAGIRVDSVRLSLRGRGRSGRRRPCRRRA